MHLFYCPRKDRTDPRSVLDALTIGNVFALGGQASNTICKKEIMSTLTSPPCEIPTTQQKHGRGDDPDRSANI